MPCNKIHTLCHGYCLVISVLILSIMGGWVYFTFDKIGRNPTESERFMNGLSDYTYGGDGNRYIFNATNSAKVHLLNQDRFYTLYNTRKNSSSEYIEDPPTFRVSIKFDNNGYNSEMQENQCCTENNIVLLYGEITPNLFNAQMFKKICGAGTFDFDINFTEANFDNYFHIFYDGTGRTGWHIYENKMSNRYSFGQILTSRYLQIFNVKKKFYWLICYQRKKSP